MLRKHFRRYGKEGWPPRPELSFEEENPPHYLITKEEIESIESLRKTAEECRKWLEEYKRQKSY